MKPQSRCKKCVMDISAKEITFDEEGICNFCRQAEKSLKEIKLDRDKILPLIAQIKRDGKGKKYDVLIGLSGGVDSSYALDTVKWAGLRPLCFTVDNGWNDSKADENILRMVEELKFPFYRYTIDLPKFKSLQGAFLQAGLPNAEIPTDHILMATSLEMAAKYKIKWIISGGNVATESIMPPSWGYNASDLTHIKDVYKKMTGTRLKGLPLCSVWKWNYYKWVKGIKTLYLLDYFEYDREQAIALLARKYGYQSYGDKHCESEWTKWFQNFYLFRKFGFDKRKPHYSAMINSGQMTREDALLKLQEPLVYPEFGIEQRVLDYPKRTHEEFKMDKWYSRIGALVRKLR